MYCGKNSKCAGESVDESTDKMIMTCYIGPPFNDLLYFVYIFNLGDMRVDI